MLPSPLEIVLEYSGLAIIQPLAMGTDAIASLVLYDKYPYTQQYNYSFHRQTSTDTPAIHPYINTINRTHLDPIYRPLPIYLFTSPLLSPHRLALSPNNPSPNRTTHEG